MTKEILDSVFENDNELKKHFTSQNSLDKIFKNFKSNDIRITSINYNYYIKLFLNSLKNLSIFFGFFFIYLDYFLSLEICSEGIEECSKKVEWISKKIKQEIISCVLMTIMIQLMIFNVVPKKHLIHILIAFIFFFKYSHGLNFDDHGYFNLLYYFVLLSLFSIILIPLDFILKQKKVHNNLKIIIIYLLIIIYSNFFLSDTQKNCNDWGKGLNNTFIENDKSKYGCQIQFPKICIYKILGYFQDYSKLLRKNCRNYKNGKLLREKILKHSFSPYINNKTLRIGYPLLNKDSKTLIDFPNILQNFFLNNLVDMDNKVLLNEHFKENIPEVEINFTNINDPKLIINLHYNESLSEERKLLEKNTEPFSNNILILYLDSLSRVNALRQLKKTTKFFEQFMSYKGYFHHKYPNENFHSFQFFKYHSFKGFTAGNFPFLFYGKNSTNKNKVLITKFLKENGFITSAANDWCGIDNMRTYHTFSKEEMYDHIFPICDPNNEHFNLNTIRCLYGKYNIEYLLEYSIQFWRKYKNNRKYSIIISNYAHEGTLTVVKYIDEIIANFLNDLFKDNFLKDTTVFLLSDHGVGVPSIYFSSDFYNIEMNLPILLLIINDRKNLTYKEQYKYIYENQQIFITPFDIYNLIGNLLYGNKYEIIKNNTNNNNSCKSSYGISLLEKINPKERSPMKYKYLEEMRISGSSCK